MRIIMAAGGTGGHIYPATALADAIKEKDSKSEIIFVGSKTRMESTEIPKCGYRFVGLDLGAVSGSVMKKVQMVLSMGKAYRQCVNLIKEFKPDAVIGFGNYLSVPVILAAKKMNVKIMLHEQNSYAGKANRFLGRFADAIVGCYNENLNEFPSEKTKILGNPRASVAAKVQKDPAVLKAVQVNPEKELVVIVMGSLGSQSVNAVMKEALKKLRGKSYEIVYVTGPKNYDEFIKDCPLSDNIHVLPYIDGAKVMAQASLCVVRGGATTAAEITAMGMPSIMIPSPYVPNNHQVKNAQALERINASIMVEEKDLSADVIADKIDACMNNAVLRESMAVNTKKLGFPNASEDIIQWLCDLTGVSWKN